jgi:phenylacetate-CoA ligase
VQCALATARGWRLNSVRYGQETKALVAAALERDRWSPEAWSEHTATALAGQLRAAATTVRGYSGCPDPGDTRSVLDALKAWPILTKQQLQSDPLAYISAAHNQRSLIADHTSGTTGTPLTIYSDRGAIRRWYALFEARVRRWNGVALGDRWAMLGGQLVVEVERRRPPFWVWNYAGRQLYLSVFHLSDTTVASYAEAMRAHRVRYLLGYPSAMATLADGLRRTGAEPPPLDVIISNAEPIFDHQRALIEDVFGCPMRDTYGMSEAVAGASECEAGRLHLWPDAGYIEILDDDARPVPAGTPGRIVCTGLLNAAMPLVRYDTGDRGSIAPEAGCGCGRTLPVLQSVDGRNDDVVVLADGRRIGRLDSVFKADLEVREAQIVQRAVGEFAIRVVAAPGYGDHTAAALRDRLAQRVGQARIDVEIVDAIERTANGKFRAVISLTPPER